MKIYIIGPPGSGKTTLAKKLACKYNLDFYELDCIVHDDVNKDKRTKEEITTIFEEILKKESWIIEDVGRDIFSKGLELSDVIYYIKIPKIRVYSRIFRRWFRQKLGREEYSYTLGLSNLFKITRLYYKHEKDKVIKINRYKDKVRYISGCEVNL